MRREARAWGELGGLFVLYILPKITSSYMLKSAAYGEFLSVGALFFLRSSCYLTIFYSSISVNKNLFGRSIVVFKSVR